MRRKIIRIDEAKCDGCGQCVQACAEGALRLVDGKAKLLSETYCEGLGACIGKCPQDAITIEEREAAGFDERSVRAHLQAEGQVAKSPDRQVAEGPHGGATGNLPCGCPGTLTKTLTPGRAGAVTGQPSMLGNWPVQLKLVPVTAPYFDGAKLLIAADCVAAATPEFHAKLVAGHVLLIACPKLDDTSLYQEKLTVIFAQNRIAEIEVVFMEVPCCFGLVQVVELAVQASGKSIPLTLTKVGIDGVFRERTEVTAPGCACASGSTGFHNRRC